MPVTNQIAAPSKDILIDYQPSPTAVKLHNDDGYFKAIGGPVGGGKSVIVLQDCIIKAMRQPPNRNGRRQFRLGVVRSTYPNLKRTTVRTVRDWLPSALGTIRESPPIEGYFEIPLRDGTVVEFEIMGIPLGHPDALQDLKSLEVSVFWLQEAPELDFSVVQAVSGRPGRYPPPNRGVPCAEPGVIMDFNLTDETHWIHDMFVKKKNVPTITAPDGTEFTPKLSLFLQPPAVICTNLEAVEEHNAAPNYVMNPEAENIANLPGGFLYYANQLMIPDLPKIKRDLLMMWTKQVYGKMIHADYNAKRHTAIERTTPNLDALVMIGMDTSGHNPAAVFGQMVGGQLVVMDELYGENEAFQPFIEGRLLPMLAQRYAGCQVIALCDPSNPRNALTGVTPTQTLAKYNIRAVPASSNKVQLRREAVSRILTKHEGCAIDPACSLLHEALGERYARKKKGGASSTGEDLYDDTPEDNRWTHIADAFQYLCLHVARVGELYGGVIGSAPAPVKKVSRKRVV